MRPLIRNVVIDCLDATSLASFWAAALGWEPEPMTATALADGRTSVTLVDPSDRGPRLYFQTVPESGSAKNRLHLDLNVEDAEVEARRLVSLGARDPRPFTDTLDGVVERWIVLEDPEGNVFCIQTNGSPELP